MLIPYPYDPTTQDLWLYETITVTHDLGSTVVQRPYAWNPNSLLYGYRNSLEGLVAKYRTFSTASSAAARAPFLPFNDDSDPANKPAFYNSYPPSARLVNNRLILGCTHCYGGIGNRNYSIDFETWRGSPTSYLNTVDLFRFIRRDNVVFDIGRDEISKPFSYDTAFSPSTESLFGFDTFGIETYSEAPVDPVILTDGRAPVIGDEAFVIDGSMKIVYAKTGASTDEYWKASPNRRRGHGIYPINGLLPFVYLHDSGSTCVIPIDPPSSPAAGDGVAVVLQKHIQSSNDLNFRDEIGYTSGGSIAQPIWPFRSDFNAWLAVRGYQSVQFRSDFKSRTAWNVFSQDDLDQIAAQISVVKAAIA